MAQTRRGLATGAALLAAFGRSAAAAPKGGNDGSGIATIEDYANATFEPWPPGPAGDLGDKGKWIVRAWEDYPMIALALGVMERTPEQLAALGDEDSVARIVQFAESLLDMVERYQGLVDFLSGAQVRVMAGLARYCVANEAADRKGGAL